VTYRFVPRLPWEEGSKNLNQSVGIEEGCDFCMSYRFLDHTADLGVEVSGESTEELFQSCLDALREWSFHEVGSSEVKHNVELSADTETELWFKF